MKIFLLICLANGLASTEKLDRTYLPPPGSKFSGGSAGDIQVPFEFPKETFSTQSPIENGTPELELGIKRRPKPSYTAQGSTQRPGFTYFQKSYPIPQTTTSYAFTQTTTFAPVDDYEGQDQPSGFTNASIVQQSGLPKYPQAPGQTYQQQQNRGQPEQGQNYHQYQQGQNQQSTLSPFGSTTLRPQFASNLKGLEYLPPLPPSGFKGQPPTGQDSSGYLSGLPKGPQYQDGQQFSQTTGPVINRPGFISPVINQQTQFVQNPNGPSTTAFPQYQNGQFGSITGSSQNIPASTAAPQYENTQLFSTPGAVDQVKYSENQNFPSSTAAPKYENGQRFSSPGSMAQNKYGTKQNYPISTVSPQYQDGQEFSTPVSFEQNQYRGNQNIPSSTVAPQYQDGLQFSTPGSVRQNQYRGNQNIPSSTIAPQNQDGLQFSTPGSVTLNQYPSNQIFPSSTAAPQNENGQRFPIPATQNQFTGNQKYPSSTAGPQYKNGQRISTRGPVEQNQYYSPSGATQYQNGQGLTAPGSEEQGYGSQVPNQQNQLQYPINENLGSQNIPASTTAPQYQNGQHLISPVSGQQNQYLGNQNVPTIADAQYQDGQRLTTLGSQQGSLKPNNQNQYQYMGNQKFRPSTTAPQYSDGQQFTSPESFQQNKYFGNKNTPTTAVPQFQDGQRFTTPGVQPGYGARLPTQQNYPGSQTLVENQNKQYPSTAAPQYQQTFEPTPESNQQGFIPSQNVNQYPEQPTYNQRFPSTATPQGFVGNDGIQNIPGTAVPYPVIQGTQGPQASSIYGKQPSSPQLDINSQVYGASPSATTTDNQGSPSTTVGPSPTRNFPSIPESGALGQRRPERPQVVSDRNAEIQNYENILTPEGYSYSYDTSNGIHADETGTVGDGTRAQGGFSYTGDDGKVYSVFYSADENGFQPRGDHLPTPPPIPEAIQRVIEQANKDKESGIFDDGTYNDDKYGYMKYDRPLPGLSLRNKTISLINGADLPNAYNNRFAEQNRKQSKPKGTITQKDNEEEVIFNETEDSNEQGRVDGDKIDESGAREGVKRISIGRPTINFTTESNRKYRPKGNLPIKMTVTAKVDLVKNRRPDNKSNLNRRPISDKKSQENVSDDASITYSSQDTEDLQGSQELNDEQDLVNYKDDPNSRTDFHGLNKYLPNAKGNKKRPLVQPDGTRQSSLETKKSGRPGNRKTQDDEYKPIEGVQANKQDTNQFENIRKMKPMTSTVNERNGISQNENIKSTEGKIGYEYNVPQRKFISIGAMTFPSRTSVTEKTQIQNTLRPFMTPNVYSDITESTETDEEQYDLGEKPKRPVTTKEENYPGFKEESDHFIQNPIVAKDERFDATRKPPTSRDRPFPPTRRPFGRPQTSSMPFYEDQDRNEQNKYNQSISQRPRPDSNVVYNDKTLLNTPYKEVSIADRNEYMSTTPLPHSGPDVYKGFQRTDQYQSNRPDDDSASYDETAPGKKVLVPTANKPGLVNNQGQIPSTTYRPNYTFKDETLVDGFGRPISSTNAPGDNRTYKTQGSRVSDSDEISQSRPDKMEEKFRPNVGRFGITSAPTQGTPGSYQGSTSSPIGEDFSGPKQPPRFDPETGYHYK